MAAGRIEVSGWFGAAASTHWLATQCAMGVLERGGNAFDAAVAAGLVMQVAQPHLNGPAGDVAILTYEATTREVRSVCGQGPVPGRATIEHFRGLGYDMIPGTGLLPAVVPGAFDAWMKLLVEKGTISLVEALEPAMTYAEKGIVVDQRLHDTLVAATPVFVRYWADSARLWLDGSGCAPQIGTLVRNPAYARTLQRILSETEKTRGGRTARIEAARAVWSDGFVADRIDAFCRAARVMDVSGRVNGALLRADDLSGWRATDEPVLSTEFGGHVVHKCGMWTQGPVLLQSLNMLDADRFRSGDPADAAFVHGLVEVLKLALADRDAQFEEARASALLSRDYALQRQALVSSTASHRFRPGPDAAWRPDYDVAMSRQRQAGLLAAYGGGEPTIVYDTPTTQGEPTAAERRAHMARAVGDTSYLSVADSEGNVVSATPSGGWLQSSPVIADLGFALGTRGQMMWLDEASPAALQPGRRPRTTLTPTMVTTEEGSVLAVGTPGGDQQDQWQLAFLVRYLVMGLPLQQALDAPGFHTNHLVNSFYPRGAQPGSLVVEDRFAESVRDDLRAMGHDVNVVGSWVESRLCAVQTNADGGCKAAVSRRGGQAHATAR